MHILQMAEFEEFLIKCVSINSQTHTKCQGQANFLHYKHNSLYPLSNVYWNKKFYAYKNIRYGSNLDVR